MESTDPQQLIDNCLLESAFDGEDNDNPLLPMGVQGPINDKVENDIIDDVQWKCGYPTERGARWR